MDELLGADSLADSILDLPALGISDADVGASNGAAAYMDLLSLPVFEMESLGFGEVNNGPRYLLMAPTSPMTKSIDCSVTYLNKGQSYEIALEALGKPEDYRSGLIRTSLRMSFFYFSEIAMRNQEQDQWAAWSAEHPGERVLEVETGFMVENITHDISQPNLVMFDWYASKGGTLMVKVNCLSSEFAPKRHGGEKGILLRLEIDAYVQHSKSDSFELFHASNCHIKVFKDKGADRKHKQEMQRLCQMSTDDRAALRPTSTVTVFQDFCISVCNSPKTLPPGAISLENSVFTSPTLPQPVTGNTCAAVAFALKDSPSVAAPDSVDSGTGSFIDSSPAQAPAAAAFARFDVPFSESPLRVDSTVQQTQEWLVANGFDMHRSVFNNYAGVDLLKLQRGDMKEILGEAEGIRLNNALQTRSVRPLQVFYVVQASDAYYRGVYLYSCTVSELQGILARHTNLLPAQISSMHWYTSAGVPVVVDREVLMNLPSESTFRLEKKLRLGSDSAGGLEEFDIHLYSAA